MASYVVMEPPAETGKDTAERTVFVRDGFSFLALIMPVIWLLFYRLWFEAGLVLAAAVALGVAGEYWGAPGTATILTLLISILVALEGNNWRLSALRRKGYAEKGVIEADDRAEAEIRYFSNGATAPATRKKRASRSASTQPDARLGLVGFSGEN
ncbi:hypothetical protein GCM10011491_18000 [Brucella endophytica]|uniref:DUF2628 domain-containing protein n=1 Tax=Brucella endophytica TaxID=1963359 RepID=A0A916SA45_9HYPH|nr:DUF2628 domain-containing protein [Brucella endophytica]GGA90471.1 hypothetical protein GCM10011491_18000 [Brucella endophytica]